MRHLIVGILTILSSLGAMRAATIVSTFAPNAPGYASGGYEINSAMVLPFFSQDLQWAMAFTVPEGPNFTFTGFVVPMTFSGTATEVDFTLASDAGNSPGSPLETIDVSLANGTALYTGSSVLQPTLISGTTYWLEAAIDPADTGNSATWNPSEALPGTGLFFGLVADRNLPMFPNWSVVTATQAAFEIDGTAVVPEPQCAWVAILLLLGAARAKAVRSAT